MAASGGNVSVPISNSFDPNAITGAMENRNYGDSFFAPATSGGASDSTMKYITIAVVILGALFFSRKRG